MLLREKCTHQSWEASINIKKKKKKIKSVYTRLYSSTLVYIYLDSSSDLSTVVYICLDLSSDSSTLFYIRLHWSSDSSVFLE